MKFLFSIVLITLTVLTVCGQFFEGKIVYQHSFKSKLPNMSDTQLTSSMGSKQEYLIKGGNYKTVSNGTSFLGQIYMNKDNKLYNKFSHSETILWIDGGRVDDPVLEIAHNKDVTEILGYKCDELILESKSQTEKFYFNSKLGVDIDLYSKHLLGNWYEYLKVAKALPLKTVIDNHQFTMIGIATEIKAMKVDDKQFQLPPNAKIAKSPN